MKKRRSSEKSSWLPVVRALVIGTVCGALLCGILLTLCSIGFVSAKHIPQGLLQPIVIAISVLSSFLAGYIAAKVSHEKGLLFGSLCGLILFLLFLIAGFVAQEEITMGLFTKLVIMVCSGAIGGLLSVSRKSKRK